MPPKPRILSPGAVPMALAANLFVLRVDLVLTLLIIGLMLLFMLLQHGWYKQARERQARQHAFG